MCKLAIGSYKIQALHPAIGNIFINIIASNMPMSTGYTTRSYFSVSLNKTLLVKYSNCFPFFMELWGIVSYYDTNKDLPYTFFSKFSYMYSIFIVRKLNLSQILKLSVMMNSNLSWRSSRLSKSFTKCCKSWKDDNRC